jgi:hypothetical protein
MRRLLCVPLLLALVACPDPIDTGSDGGGALVVGPEGGRFIREGAFIDIPANAVASETVIEVDVLDEGIPEIPGRTRISFGFRFRPTTLKFKEPVTIGLWYFEERLPSKGIDLSTLDMRRRTGEDPYLQLPSPRTLPEQVVTARSDSLGTFWITSPDKPAVSELKLTPTQATLAVGQTQQFVAEVTDPGGTPLPDVEVSWSVLPARVAKVSPEGFVEALSPGTALLTATSVGLSKTVPVFVIGTTPSPNSFLHENPFPTGNDLLGGAVAAGQLLLVGRNGTVLSRSAQGDWTRHFSTPGLELRGVGGSFPGPAVAVGVLQNSGVLVEIADAQSAPAVKIFPTSQPRALWFDGTHGMAVGDGNDVLVRRGGQWVAEYSPSFERLLDVQGDGAGGFVTVGGRGSLYVFDAATQTWDSLFQTQLSVLLTAAALDDAQGSGAWGVGGGQLWRFEGQGWTALNLPSSPALETLTAVGMLDGRVLVGGRTGRQGHLLVYEPSSGTWSSAALMRSPQVPRAMVRDGAQAGFVVGDFGAVWRYQGGEFSEVSSGFYGDVADVFAAPDAVVAVANECMNPTCSAQAGRVYLRSADGSWQPLGFQPFSGKLLSVAAKSATDVWAGGEGVLWRFDGAGWTPFPVSPRIRDLAVCGDDYWAVGDLGSVFRGTTSLGQQPSRGSKDLYAVHCPTPTEVWAAGDGVLFRGATPVNDTQVNHGPWRAVWSPGVNEAYAFGDARYGVYWNTQRMLPYDQPAGLLPDVVTGLWGASVDTLYAVGHTVVPQPHGFALRFNGAQWALVDAGASRKVNAVHGRSATEIWLGTEGGGVLRGVPPPMP